LIPGISVIVCCYNSARRLPETLRHLALQVVPASLKWEVIVVDNASDDETAATAAAEWRKYCLPNVVFKVLSEPIPGKNNALHKGVEDAAFEYVVICDDDNRLNENYLEKAFEIMRSDLRIGAASGQGIPVSEITLPDWFASCQHAYAVGKQGSGSGDISPKEYLWGAGMIFRKSLYIRIYAQFPSFLTGPNGTGNIRGEDVEFCLRILLAGFKLYYDDALVYKHFLPSERLTLAYRQKLYETHPYEKRILNLYNRQLYLCRLSWLKKAYFLFLSLVRFCISKIRAKSRWDYIHEAEMISLLTGISLIKVPGEVTQIGLLRPGRFKNA
jgi:glycosyltransferase involved in cell wall biosynthesis